MSQSRMHEVINLSTRKAEVDRMLGMHKQARVHPTQNSSSNNFPFFRKQQASSSSIHRRAMEDTEQARQKYLIACNDSKKVQPLHVG